MTAASRASTRNHAIDEEEAIDEEATDDTASLARYDATQLLLKRGGARRYGEHFEPGP